MLSSFVMTLCSNLSFLMVQTEWSEFQNNYPQALCLKLLTVYSTQRDETWYVCMRTLCSLFEQPSGTFLHFSNLLTVACMKIETLYACVLHYN
ncbi:hypothetical protein GBAR_LOCUS14023 [Geodia barretti]|uniref:Secreted protein n=2 Tax=Geodia barretti TaxID=519541 RepID=A0AA35S6Z6_GEOBA|nr:hypothetical protein GBAR_LOCUS14023 [Geodia barretti]